MHLTHIIIRFGLISLIFLCFCGGIKLKRYTPKEFLNYTIVPRSIYIEDSVKIARQLTLLLLKREEFFSNTACFDSTQLFVDTILYSTDFNKLAAFIITKNPSSRQLIPDRKYDWYYDATCYLGIRQHDSLDLYWIGPSFTNSYNMEELSDIIHDAYFTSFATRDTSAPFVHKYNLNDKRFWNSDIWQQIEKKKVEREAFEIEKIEHPENVYIPHRQILKKIYKEAIMQVKARMALFTDFNHAKDKNILELQFKALMANHKKSIHSKEYFDSTELRLIPYYMIKAIKNDNIYSCEESNC